MSWLLLWTDASARPLLVSRANSRSKTILCPSSLALPSTQMEYGDSSAVFSPVGTLNLNLGWKNALHSTTDSSPPFRPINNTYWHSKLTKLPSATTFSAFFIFLSPKTPILLRFQQWRTTNTHARALQSAPSSSSLPWVMYLSYHDKCYSSDQILTSS